ncbi:DUF992 domain-containing protein [Mesorhizobium marinum]|uniref:DUF992 domain-containing protein n=1 Tax=Mesorhizobium marinum TaxID=3228790 RepID=UPI00346590F8
MKHLLIAAASAALLAVAVPAGAQNEGIELGKLDCRVEGGAGFVIGSTKDVLCTYTPADASMAPETYHGEIRKIGLDVGVTGETLMTWVVLAPSKDIYAAGALAGNYVGAGAEASVAVGGGANLLVGGSDKTFTLQPLSVQAQTGLNIAVGVTDFQLRASAG